MTNEEMVTNWLKENTNLSWNRTSGDSPAVKVDANFINRSEAYEIRDLIMIYYNHCKIKFSNSNLKITLNKINKYKSGEKVKRENMLNYLINNIECKGSKV